MVGNRVPSVLIIWTMDKKSRNILVLFIIICKLVTQICLRTPQINELYGKILNLVNIGVIRIES